MRRSSPPRPERDRSAAQRCGTQRGKVAEGRYRTGKRRAHAVLVLVEGERSACRLRPMQCVLALQAVDLWATRMLMSERHRESANGPAADGPLAMTALPPRDRQAYLAHTTHLGPATYMSAHLRARAPVDATAPTIHGSNAVIRRTPKASRSERHTRDRRSQSFPGRCAAPHRRRIGLRAVRAARSDASRPPGLAQRSP